MTSSIPETATEVVARRDAFGEIIDCYARTRLVGYRMRNERGGLEWEYEIRRGRKHGYERYWSPAGRLTYERFFVAGKQHGLARQWSNSGLLLGSYRMQGGTGVEVWWADNGDIAEERHFRRGMLWGLERWWNEDQTTIYIERHWREGYLHGIVREWMHGALKPGHPEFYLNGKKVTARTYSRMCGLYPSLPKILAADDNPARPLPGTHLRQVKRRAANARMHRSSRAPT